MNDKETIELLPDWFKEKYKVELSEYKTAGRYWIKAEDIFRLINDLINSSPSYNSRTIQSACQKCGADVQLKSLQLCESCMVTAERLLLAD